MEMSKKQLRDIITLLEELELKPLDHDSNKQRLEVAGWNEDAGIALWLDSDDPTHRFMIDTNPDETIILYDELNGYGEAVIHTEDLQEVFDHINKLLKHYPDGKEFVISYFTHKYNDEGQHTMYLDANSRWTYNKDEAVKYTKKEAEELIPTLEKREKVELQQKIMASDLKWDNPDFER